MLPLTRQTPKPLMPIWNVPNLERLLTMLKGWGVREVLINLHHGADRIFEHLRQRPGGLRITFSFEPEILGTGGALRKAEWFFGGADPVWVLNGDVVAEVDPDVLLKSYDATKTMAVAWLHGSRGPRTVEMDSGVIRSFRSKRAGMPGTYTFCGLQLINPKLLARASGFVPADPVFGTLVAAYERAQAAGWTIAGVEAPGSYWADIGTPAQYLACHRELKGGVDFAAVDPTARVADGARIRNAVIGAGAVLGPRARIENAVVAPDTLINRPVSYLAMPAIHAWDEAPLALLKKAGWQPERCAALPFGPRGSARAFSRVACGTRTAIVVQYDPARKENAWYTLHARFLRRLGLPVPQVLADDPAACVSLFEDVGDVSVESCFDALSEAKRETVYGNALDVLVRWHEEGARAARREKLPLMQPFRPALYRWERAYFAEHMLRKRCGMSPRDAAVIQRELAGMARALACAPDVLVHRDLQSSNVLLRAGHPWFIDFQGMRFGPAVYDLASLLCDPYVRIGSSLRGRLLERYARQSASPGLIRELFWHGAVQRLSQALGAFARLGAQRETASFARHIPAALGLMREALEQAPGCIRLRGWIRDMSQP